MFRNREGSLTGDTKSLGKTECNSLVINLKI